MAKRNERCSCGAYTCFCSHNNSAEDAYYANDELDDLKAELAKVKDENKELAGQLLAHHLLSQRDADLDTTN
jgi:hypothetical protein